MSSRAFLLEQIEETYNVDFLLALYQKKYSLGLVVGFFNFFGWAIG